MKKIKMPKATEDSPTFVMQDLETGKVEPADDLAKALFGKAELDDSMFQEISAEKVEDKK